MRVLEFDVSETTLNKDKRCNFEHIIRNSVNFLQCSFSFDNTWRNFAKVAVFVAGFKEYPVLISDNKVAIPSEATKREVFSVYVVGQNAKGTKLQTNRIEIEQEV